MSLSMPTKIYYDSRTESVRLPPINDDNNDEYCTEMNLKVLFEDGNAFISYEGFLELTGDIVDLEILNDAALLRFIGNQLDLAIKF